VSMTPDLSAVSRVKADSTPVRLADHSLVEATHKGVSKLPLDADATVTTLVVPALAKPLLSIAGLCDAGLTVIFTKQSCDIYSTPDFQPLGKTVGKGYRRGNLYYLPSEPVSSPSTSFSPISSHSAKSASIDNSLLGYHWRFSHIGLKPLKQLLKLHGIKRNRCSKLLNLSTIQAPSTPLQIPLDVQVDYPRRNNSFRRRFV
jgi:hypothetical protein